MAGGALQRDLHQTHLLPNAMVYPLNCIVLGEKNIFQVKINETQSVIELKQEIKKGKDIRFKDIDADELTLHRIKINLDVSDEDEYDRILDEVSKPGYMFTSKRKLRDAWEISQYFGDPSHRPKMTIHILMELPQSKSIDP